MILIFLKCRCGLNLRGTGFEQRRGVQVGRRDGTSAGAVLRAGSSSGSTAWQLMAWFVGVIPRPSMRAIAPERESRTDLNGKISKENSVPLRRRAAGEEAGSRIATQSAREQ